jgi:hypothetical protein
MDGELNPTIERITWRFAGRRLADLEATFTASPMEVTLFIHDVPNLVSEPTFPKTHPVN